MSTWRPIHGATENAIAAIATSQVSAPGRGRRGSARKTATPPRKQPTERRRPPRARRSQPTLCSEGGPPATQPLKNASFRKNSAATRKRSDSDQRKILMAAECCAEGCMCGLTFELSRPWRQGSPADQCNVILGSGRPGSLAGAGRLERRVRPRLLQSVRRARCAPLRPTCGEP
jgi:hypothetical protein